MYAPLSSFLTEKGYLREYFKWQSQYLGIDMEILAFGHGGHPVLLFPTRTARFFDYENWGVLEGFREKLIAGEVQVFCVDSADQHSFYNKNIKPAERIQKHYAYEKYILMEVLPLIRKKNNRPNALTSAGCSLGAYHAVNLAFRYPQLFTKVVSMSGRYDLSIKLTYFEDLFEGYNDEHIYAHTPTKFLPNIHNPNSLELLRKLDITIVIGEDDAFLMNNNLLHQQLIDKGIEHRYFIWQGEAHKAQYWTQMVKLYF